MTLREHAEKLAEHECAMLCGLRRNLGFPTPDILAPGDEKIIIRNVRASLKASFNPVTQKKRYRMSPQFLAFLIFTLVKIVKLVIERRNALAGTKPTWGGV